MLLQRTRDEDARCVISSRIPVRIRDRLKARVGDSSDRTLSSVVAELLEAALDFEEQLEPFRPAIERLMREEGLTVAGAVARLLWMDVQDAP